MSRSGSRNPPQISSAFTSTAVIPFPGGNFANPANPISEDTERLPELNERGDERDGARFCDRWWKLLAYNTRGSAFPIVNAQHLSETFFAGGGLGIAVAN